MTNTKWLSALLAGTALSVASTAALADTSFLTMTRNAAGEGVTFRISPTADMPAAATEVTVAGEVRALLRSSKTIGVAGTQADPSVLAFSESDRENDIATRARIFVRGKTETAVGVVGAKLRIQDAGSSAASINQYTGYWEFSPGMTLTAGKMDSISSVIYGADWNGTGGVWNGAGAGLTNQAMEQVNVSFATGPVSFAIGLEDNTTSSQYVDGVAPTTSTEGNPGIAANMTFSSGDFGAQITGRTQRFDATPALNGDDGYVIGGGIGYSAGAFGLELGAASGRGLGGDYVTGTSDILEAVKDVEGSLDLTDDKFSAGSILATFSLTETTSIEAWYGMGKISNVDATTLDYKVSGYGAGIFWNPVSQLRLGVGGDMTTVKYNGVETDGSRVGVGAWFKF